MNPNFHHQLSPQQAPFSGRLGIAVSGGCDSIALTLLLCQAGWSKDDLLIIHVDHAVRVQSAADAQFVAAFAKQQNIAFVTKTLTHDSEISKTPDGLRQARRRFFFDVIAKQKLAAIALAHHADDQRETRWLAMIRGAGLRGLSGMPMWQAPFWRPLLTTTRSTLRQYLLSQQVSWCDDPTNMDFKYPRTRLRHHILPTIARPLTEEEILRTTMLQAEDAFLTNFAHNTLAKITTGPMLERTAFDQVDIAIARRVLKQWLPTKAPLNRIEALRLALQTKQDRLRIIEMGAGLSVLLDQHVCLYYWPKQLMQHDHVMTPQQNLTWQGLTDLCLKKTAPNLATSLDLTMVALSQCRKNNQTAKQLDDFLKRRHVPASLRYLWPVAFFHADYAGTLDFVSAKFKASWPTALVGQIKLESKIWLQLLQRCGVGL